MRPIKMSHRTILCSQDEDNLIKHILVREKKVDMVWSGDYFGEQSASHERLIVACLSSGSSAQFQGILQSVFMYFDLKPANGMLLLISP